MSANRVEAHKPNGEAAAGEATPGKAPEKGGGLGAWLPLLLNLLLMPALAYATVAFVLLPKLQPPAGGSDAEHESQEAKGGEHGAKPAAKSAHPAKGKARVAVPLAKSVVVNVMGTQGTRFLLGNFTLVGATTDFEARIKESDPQLRDLAAGVLAGKSVQDLEKPGARNLVRGELISAFNNALGGNLVHDIYMTEFAIQ
jgi:flagellar protein FliL